MDNGECVLSDIHVEKIVSDSSKVQVTRFVFRVPPSENDPLLERTAHNLENNTAAFDEDGDFEFCRTLDVSDCDVIRLFHRMSTELDSVGLQVWRGALVLCDYIQHYKDLFVEKHVLELGCGTGLTGIVVGQYAASVICTDYSQEVLNLCRQNIDENSRFMNSNGLRSVEKLDWFKDLNVEDLKIIPNFVLVADCVYDNDLTDALFRILYKFITVFNESKPVILISLEKRLNFTLNELNVTCREYDHFRRCLKEFENYTDYSARKLSLESLPLYFDYVRTDYVELWEIHS